MCDKNIFTDVIARVRLYLLTMRQPAKPSTKTLQYIHSDYVVGYSPVLICNTKWIARKRDTSYSKTTYRNTITAEPQTRVNTEAKRHTARRGHRSQEPIIVDITLLLDLSPGL